MQKRQRQRPVQIIYEDTWLPWGLYYKTFYGSAFCTKSDSFRAKTGSQLLELSPVKGSTLMSSSLTCKYSTKVEVTDSGKHCSLLQHGKIYCCKKFYSTGQRLIHNRQKGSYLCHFIQGRQCKCSTVLSHAPVASVFQKNRY